MALSTYHPRCLLSQCSFHNFCRWRTWTNRLAFVFYLKFTSCGTLSPLLEPFRCGKLSHCTWRGGRLSPSTRAWDLSPWADLSHGLTLARHDGGRVQQLERVAPGHVAPLAGHRVGLGVAALAQHDWGGENLLEDIKGEHLAHDLHVRGVAAEEGVQRTLAVTAREAALELYSHFHSLQTLISIGFLFPCCMRYEVGSLCGTSCSLTPSSPPGKPGCWRQNMRTDYCDLCSPSRCTLGNTSRPPCLGSGASSRSPRRRNAASSWELLSHEFVDKITGNYSQDWWKSETHLPLCLL